MNKTEVKNFVDPRVIDTTKNIIGTILTILTALTAALSALKEVL